MPISVSAPSISAPRKAALLRFVEKYFYTFMSLLITAIVTYGFSRTADQNLIHASVPRPVILWYHAALCSGWLLFFILQSSLVRFHNVNLHRTLGWLGAAMGFGILVTGIITTVTMMRFHAHQLHQTDLSFFLVPFWDITCYAFAFGLAVYWRRRPDNHRRFTLIATCALAAAGIGRFPPQIVPPGTLYVGVDLLILMGVARDLLVDRCAHVVYRIALPILIVGQTFVMYTVITKPAYWMRIIAAIAN